MGSLTDLSLERPAGLADGSAVYRDAFRAALRPDRVYTVSEWADEHRLLSAKSASEHGRWRTARTPYLREIMDHLSPSHPATELTFVKGTQLGGSEAGYNWIGAVIDLWPAPTMLVMPTVDTAKRISKQRIAPMIEETPALAVKVTEAKSRDSGNTLLMKDFPGGVLVLTGANSAPGLRSMPVRFLFMDEVDAYPLDADQEGDPCVLAEKRTQTFSRRKIFRVSSPKLRINSRIERYYDASDQRRYHVPCPHCAHEQWLRWDQVRWETRKVWEITRSDDGETIEVPADTEGATERDTRDPIDAWYECEVCEGRVDNHHKTEMLAAGHWVALRSGSGRHPGWHLSSLYSPVGWFSWFDAVRQFLLAEADISGEAMQGFQNTVLGISYDQAGDQPDESELKKHVGAHRLGGKVPRAALLLTCGVDVQGDRLEARVWGFGRGEESWLVAREIVFGSYADENTWLALEELLFRAWPHEGGSTLKITATAVDASDGNSTHFVRNFARKWSHCHVIAVKGQAIAGKPILGRPTDQDVTHHGKIMRGAVKLWPMGSDTAKALIYARYRVAEHGSGYVHLPQGLPEDEFAQMTAEKVVTRYVKGFARREWTKQPSARNEALDCFVMALAAAHYAGIGRVNWDRLEALLIQPDMFIASAPAAEAEAGPPREDGGPPPEQITTPQPALRGFFVAPPPRRGGSWATGWKA